MGNPHPTKSKPVKIGRKHSGAKSEKLKQKLRNKAKKAAQIKAAIRRKNAKMVHEYFMGLRDELPGVARW